MMMIMGAMMVVAMIVVMIVVMVVLLGFQEFGLDVEDAVEVEGVAAEHLGDVRPARAGCGAAWHKD